MTPNIRKATESDLIYVRHSWGKASYSSFKSALFKSHQAEVLPCTLYEQLFKRWQGRILSRATCLVAANPEDDDQLMGYAIFEGEKPPVLHFVQVKNEFWRQGIARALLDAGGINESVTTIYSFGTPLGTRNIPKIWTHVPYYLQPQLEMKR